MAALVAGVVLFAGGCKGGDGKEQPRAEGSARQGRGGGGGPKFPVEVYPVEMKRTEYTVMAPGTVDAFERVQVTARVAGAIDKVSFTEGQKVKTGDVLVVIDSERFAAAANSSKALLDKALATQQDAEAMSRRREEAIAKAPGLITEEERATFKTKELAARADAAVAKEALRAAQINLRDAWVRAPMDGVIQTRTVETGQYVQPGYVMATLLRRDPMLLRFQVTPLDAPRIQTGMTATFTLRETTRQFKAKVTLVAGAADEETRMVRVTAEVVNEGQDYSLRPGAFCEVTLGVGGARDVVMIPRTAVRPTERGFVAYVIEKDIARERVMQLGANTRDGWVEVLEGLKAGDKLVVQGAEPLSEGARVGVTEVPPPVSEAFLPSQDAAPAGSGAAVADPPASPASPPPAAASGRRRK